MGGKFCIHGVTGPDEYNTVVNNNTYTNLMARENLRYAAATVEELRNERPGLFAALVDKTGLELSEVDEWKRAADRMYIPFNEMLGIHPQDDAFLEKEALGLRQYAGRPIPLTVALPPAGYLPAPSHQASGHRLGHVSPRS